MLSEGIAGQEVSFTNVPANCNVRWDCGGKVYRLSMCLLATLRPRGYNGRGLAKGSQNVREQLARDYYRRLYGPSLAERIKYAWEQAGQGESLKERFARVWNEEPLRYARKFREEDHPRGQPDNAGQFAEKPGGKGKGKPKAKSPNAGKAAKKKTDSERVARAKASHKLVAEDIQRYAEEHNEPQFAKKMKGRSLPNGEPVDVVLPNPDAPTHGIELKTMVDNGNDKLTMDSYSQVRKILWEKETGATVHTIVIDDRNVYSADGNHKPESNRKYYYRRGVAGSARIGSLHEVKSIKELRRLMDMDEADLPPKAQRTDAKLRVGKWRPIRDGNKKKGFQNTKTGKVFMAKK